jgi:hypothetical protein
LALGLRPKSPVSRGRASSRPRTTYKIESEIDMQCGCPQCGILMAQVEKGLESACVCPECGYSCRACLGGLKGADKTMEKGLSKEEWESILHAREESVDDN